MRAVVRGSLILMITAANLYKFKGRHDSPAGGFNWHQITVHSFEKCHRQSSAQCVFVLEERLFTSLKLFSTPPRARGFKATVAGLLPSPLHLVEQSGVT